MSTLRKYVRGDRSVDRSSVAHRLVDEDGFTTVDEIELTPLEAGNWLSIPYVVNDEYFVKAITQQNTLTHSFFTGIRNLGARVSGGGPFFETYDSPVDMARHELESTRRMREIGVPAPEPLQVIDGEDDALIVYEYLDGYVPLEETALDDRIVDETFRHLRTMHDHGVAHGDFSPANVLVVDDEPHFIDTTNVSEDGLDDAVAYDLACAMGGLSARMEPEDVVGAASRRYSATMIERSLDFLLVARLRPGLERRFSLLELRAAIDDAV